MKKRGAIFTLAAAVLMVCGCGSPMYMGQHPSTYYRDHVSEIPEEIASLEKIAVQPGKNRPSLTVERDHEGPTGTEVAEGTVAGIEFTGQMIGEDPSGIILVPIILPVAMIAGAISGGMVAEIRQAQKEQADQFLEIESQPLPSEVMAKHVQSYFASTPVIDSVLIGTDAVPPDETAAVLTIEVQSLFIDIVGYDASMTIKAIADLRYKKDPVALRQQGFSYTVTNTLNDWVNNNTERWNEFVTNALHYFATRISEDFFQKIRLRHVLRPVDSDTRSYTPTLAWELILLGGDSYADWEQPVGAADARYTLEIYQADRLVYSANHILGTRHTVQKPLQGCKTYRWSVQPIYPVGNRTLAGNWMRERNIGLVLTYNSPQLVQARNIRKDFPKFKTPCNTR